MTRTEDPVMVCRGVGMERWRNGGMEEWRKVEVTRSGDGDAVKRPRTTK